MQELKEIILIMMFCSVFFTSVPFCEAISLTDKEVLMNEEFDGDSGNWDVVGAGRVVLKDGCAILPVGSTKEYYGTAMVLKKSFKIPAKEGEFLHLSIKVNGFSESKGTTDFKAGARIFLTPESFSKRESIKVIEEPYVNPNVFWTFFEYNSTENNLFFFRKVNASKEGVGVPVYSGEMPSTNFPLVIDIYLDRETYYVQFSKDVVPRAGSRSGLHRLPSELWSGNLRFGIRIVNHQENIDSNVLLDHVRISVAERRVQNNRKDSR